MSIFTWLRPVYFFTSGSIIALVETGSCFNIFNFALIAVSSSPLLLEITPHSNQGKGATLYRKTVSPKKKDTMGLKRVAGLA